MKLGELVSKLDAYLDIGRFQDEMLNGLQLGDFEDDIVNVSLGVRLSDGVIDCAKKNKVNLLITHHGLFMVDEVKPIIGDTYRLLKQLIKANLNLYTCHLPLDAHNEIGNNITLARLIELEDIQPFGFYKGGPLGFRGRFKNEVRLNDLVRRLDKCLNTKSQLIQAEKMDSVKTAAVISGRGAFALAEAIEYDVDLLITGEPSQGVYHPAQQGGVSMIFAGHYQTECLGVKSLCQKLIHEFGLNCSFIDIE
ncbi:MAG: Nif3-like dinuclear metal center hexameric protein [bacterium]